MIIALLFAAVLFLAYANGANDTFKGVATLFGCGAAGYRTALAWATLTTLTGSLCAIAWAQTLLARFSGKGLAPDALVLTPSFILAVAAGAGLTVIIATRAGFPVSTTHALLGALVGATVVTEPAGLNLAALRNNFVAPLLLSPLAAILLAIVVYGLLRRLKPNAAGPVCICAEPEIIAGPDSGGELVGPAAIARLIIGPKARCLRRGAAVLAGIDRARLEDAVHFLSAGAVCFARGLNDTPKIAALLLLTPFMSTPALIFLVAVMMALGGLLNARRVAETMSHKITAVSHGQGLAANLTTALLVIFASKFGLPVSTTHVSVGSLFGIGLINRKTNGRMMASIVLSWILTLPCGALLAAGLFSLNIFMSV